MSEGVRNQFHIQFPNCPYEIPDLWEYEDPAAWQWFVDPTLNFTCTRTREEWEEEQNLLS